MLVGFEDKSAYAQCIFSFTTGPEEEPVSFIGRVKGRIVAPRGPKNFGWDPIFQPDGSDLTFAEMTSAQKHEISHRFRSINAMRAYLNASTTSE